MDIKSRALDRAKKYQSRIWNMKHNCGNYKYSKSINRKKISKLNELVEINLKIAEKTEKDLLQWTLE